MKRRAPPEPEPEVTKEEREAALARKHKISSNKLKEPNRKTWQEKMEESKKLQERRRGHERRGTTTVWRTERTPAYAVSRGRRSPDYGR